MPYMVYWLLRHWNRPNRDAAAAAGYRVLSVFDCAVVVSISVDTDNNVLIIITPAECVVSIFWNKRYT